MRFGLIRVKRNKNKNPLRSAFILPFPYSTIKFHFLKFLFKNFNKFDKLVQVGVISTPDIHSFELTERDQFVILGCDGLWGVLIYFS